jgi:bleomycin hydrolase
MKKLTVLAFSMAIFAQFALAQNVSKGKVITENKGKGFYYESILKDVRAVEEKQAEKEPFKRFVMDQSGLDLPNNPSL